MKKAVGLVHPRLKIKPMNGSTWSDQGEGTHPPERQKRVLSVIPDTSASSQRKRVIRLEYNRFQGFVKATMVAPSPDASAIAKGRRGDKRAAHAEQFPIGGGGFCSLVPLCYTMWVDQEAGRLNRREMMEVSGTTLAIESEPIPLETDADGVVRVGGTRVTLDTVVAAFKEGATAEEIVYQYPSLNLADVYSVIGYYLQRQADVEAYLHRRRQQRDMVRAQNETRFDPQGIRERLLARRA
jgi:uncharacterized protein (DUF433 family)